MIVLALLIGQRWGKAQFYSTLCFSSVPKKVQKSIASTVCHTRVNHTIRPVLNNHNNIKGVDLEYYYEFITYVEPQLL